MRGHRMIAASALRPVRFISSGAVVVSTSLTLPAITASQMLIFCEGITSATPPALKSGFTNITTVANSGGSRSFRVQYVLGERASEVLPALTGRGYGYMVLQNGKRIGALNTANTPTGTSLTPVLASLSNVTADQRSLVVASIYAPGYVTGVAGSYVFTSGFGYQQHLASSSISASTFTMSTAAYSCCATFEVRPI